MYSPGEGIEKRSEFLLNLIKDILSGKYEIVTKRENHKEVSYYNIPAAFDIETSSWYNDDSLKCATMYWWTFGIYNHVTSGRTWEELKELLEKVIEILSLTNSLRLAVFIHNLPYEWQFIRKHFEWDKTFFTESRKPLYCLFHGIELRDSLKLAMKKLESLAKDLTKYHTQKMVGDLDYSKLRHFMTPLTPQEQKYCENDIRVLLHYIQEKIESDGGIHKIPLTNTGYVRNYCRRECYGYGKKNPKYQRYRRIMNALTMTADEYVHIRKAYQGGYTHASPFNMGRYESGQNGKVHENVGSYDYRSSYPYTIVVEKFPMSSATYYKELSEQELFSLTEYHCLTFTVTFTRGLLAKPKVPDLYISKSKIDFTEKDHEEPIVYNGRIFGTSDSFSYTCVDQDLFIIMQVYDIPKNSMRFTEIYAYKKGFLPTPLVRAVVKLYKDKTLLKGKLEDEDKTKDSYLESLIDYMIKKGMLNSVYGMMVTDIIREQISYINDEYKITESDIEEQIKKYNENKKRFLFYPWGVWVTAYARANLWSGILACGADYLYSDTDSVKLKNFANHKHYFDSYNEDVIKKLKVAARYHKIPLSDLIPEVNGIKYPLGAWSYEGKYPEPAYKRFKTMGAKRYLVENPDGTYSLTVAGLGKKAGVEYLVNRATELNVDPFELFNFGLYVPPGSTGKQCLTYIDCDSVELREELTDYLGGTTMVTEKSFIHMEEKDYHFNQESQFFEFLMLMEEWI